MREKYIIRTARVFSALFSPFYMPLIGIAALFVFSYYALFPVRYKLVTLAVVYIFTILIPKFTIFVYRKLNGWTPRQLDIREKRLVPYLLTIASYICCLYLMVNPLRMPRYISGILMAALMLQIVCAFINIWWKISTHTAGAGGVTGALVAFAFLAGLNPTLWLSVALLLAGAAGSSRIILRQHTQAQVAAGFGVGFVCGFVGIYFI